MNTSTSMTPPPRLPVARRFRPGDMARISKSLHASLIDSIVIVEEWLDEYGEWGVCLTTGFAYGASVETGEIIKSRRCSCRDSSLAPLYDDRDIVVDVSGRFVAEVA